jgi:hypothetical protein
MPERGSVELHPMIALRKIGKVRLAGYHRSNEAMQRTREQAGHFCKAFSASR